MYNETIQPLETNAQYLGWGPILLGAKFVRGQVCHGAKFVRGRNVPESLTVLQAPDL